MTGDQPRVLHCIEKRHDVLSQLVSGVTDQRRLCDSIGISRPTLSRALHQLEENDLVQSTGSEYQPTPLGRVAWELYDETLSAFQRLTKSSEALSFQANPYWNETMADLVSLIVRDSSVRTPNKYTIDGERLMLNSEVRGSVEYLCVPTYYPFLDNIADTESNGTVLFERGVVDYVRAEEPAVYETIVSSFDNVLTTEEEINVGIVSSAEETFVVLHDYSKNVEAVLMCESTEASSAAAELFVAIESKLDFNRRLPEKV